MDISLKLDELLRIEHGFAHIIELAQEIYSSEYVRKSVGNALRDISKSIHSWYVMNSIHGVGRIRLSYKLISRLPI